MPLRPYNELNPLPTPTYLEQLSYLEQAAFYDQLQEILDSRFTQFIDAARNDFSNPEFDTSAVQKAYEMDRNLQMSVYRRSGVTSVVHPMANAEIAIKNKEFRSCTNSDVQTIYHDSDSFTSLLCTAYLHDYIEEKGYLMTDYDLEKIKEFGPETYEAVQMLTKSIPPRVPDTEQLITLSKQFKDPIHADETLSQREQLDRNLGENYSEDDANRIRTMARMVKGADVIHNLRTLYSFPDERRDRFIDETMKIWVPAFREWKMDEIADEIERECNFAPQRASEMQAKIKEDLKQQKGVQQEIERYWVLKRTGILYDSPNRSPLVLPAEKTQIIQ